jgi:hypothetical protein
MTATGTQIARVVWKDEGDFGFIHTYKQSDLDYMADNPTSIGIPYDPNRVQAYGSIADARALASEHGAELVLG